MKNSPKQLEFAESRFRYLALAAGILIYLLIVVGGVVRVTGSAGACLGWPACLGQWTPPAGQKAFIDYTHRAAALAAGILLFWAAIEAWRHHRRQLWTIRPIFFALGLTAIQAGLGAIESQPGLLILVNWLPAAHLILSLLILACTLIPIVQAFWRPTSAPRTLASKPTTKTISPFARLAFATLGAVFLVMASGAVVTSSGSSAACTSFPLCQPGGLPSNLGGWINLIHRLSVLIASGFMGVLFLQAWRTQRTQTLILSATTAAGVLFFAQALLGARLAAGFPVSLLALHQATAVAAWAALVVVAISVTQARRTVEEEAAEAAALYGRKGLAKDLLMLTKPIVVALLLVTTYAGMVIGGRAWPSLAVTFWTLLGGFMAAGGSGAINQYIDRFDDGKMQRTQKRPIPAGRLTASEGLAFGVGMALASFYLMVAFTNFLAALLTLAGIIYYVLIYSIFLKKATVQNIVIGGGAGAIPPLVGWAAATGGLNVPSLFLFAIVFMWTPPHFWSLALVRRSDYARAGVPMLPVVRGEKETRWQILLYTVELVALTLLLPLFGLGGSIYLVGAVLLGGWLLLAAWKVWKTEGNKVAWKMYRYSSMYLAFLFVALMIDRLL